MPIGAAVPYNPIQGVTQAEGVANDRITTQATPADFGAEKGAALQDVGEQISQTALKFGQMYADSSARDGVTNASKELSDAELAFKQNKGNNAVNAYKTFQDSVSQIQEKYANSMPNLAAQNKFKDDFSHEASSAIFRSGAYVADQAESAQLTSLKSSIDNNANQFALNANNPTASTYIDKIRNDTADLADHQGITDPSAIAGMSAKNIGTAISGAINSNIRTSPDLAQSIANKYLNGSYQAVGVDKDGNQVVTNVPYVDAQQRTEISNAMQQEFVRQQNQTIQDAKEYAATGDNYNKAAVVGSMQRAGRSQDDIDAMTHHLDNIQSTFGTSAARTSLSDWDENAKSLALAGKTLPPLPSDDAIAKAFPKDPEKAQQFKNHYDDLQTISSFSSSLTTMPESQANTLLAQHAPVAGTDNSSNAIDYVLKHEGGYVAVDGATNAPAIYGINQHWHPDEYAAAKKIYDEKGDAAGQAYAQNFYKTQYWDKKGISDLPSADQAIVMDGVVNHSTAFGDQLIQAAKQGASPQDLIDMRRQEYTRLATENPQAYGKSLAGWNSRLDDLQGNLPNLSQGKDFAEQSNLYANLVKAKTDYYKNLNDDPAGVITGNDTVMNSLYVQGMKDPAKMNQFISQMNARQDALQIPDANRSVLPKAYATALTNNLMQNPEQAPAQLAKMANDYGSNWPQVYKSLVQQGGMPASYQIVQHLGEDPDTQKYGTMFARYIGSDDTKNKTDEVLMGSEQNLKTLKDAVSGNSDLQQLITSFQRSGASPQQVADTIASAQKLAMSIHFYDTTDGNPAGTAIKALTSKYAYLPDGGARVPIGNLDAISANAQVKLENIENLMSPQQFVPNTYANRQQYIDDVKSSPSWVTDEANKQVLLEDHFGQPVMGRNGKQIAVGFNDAAPVKIVAPPPELTEQPNANIGRGEIAQKGSLADKLSNTQIVEPAKEAISSKVKELEEKAKEKQGQKGLTEQPNQNVGRGEIAAKGSLLDILGGDK